MSMKMVCTVPTSCILSETWTICCRFICIALAGTDACAITSGK